jgi:hypothetical protein
MKAATDDPTQLFKTQPNINATFEAAQPLMEKAVPIPALFELKDRVAKIFAPAPESTPSGPTQEVQLRLTTELTQTKFLANG